MQTCTNCSFYNVTSKQKTRLSRQLVEGKYGLCVNQSLLPILYVFSLRDAPDDPSTRTPLATCIRNQLPLQPPVIFYLATCILKAQALCSQSAGRAVDQNSAFHRSGHAKAVRRCCFNTATRHTKREILDVLLFLRRLPFKPLSPTTK